MIGGKAFVGRVGEQRVDVLGSERPGIVVQRASQADEAQPGEPAGDFRRPSASAFWYAGSRSQASPAIAIDSRKKYWATTTIAVSTVSSIPLGVRAGARADLLVAAASAPARCIPASVWYLILL